MNISKDAADLRVVYGEDDIRRLQDLLNGERAAVKRLEAKCLHQVAVITRLEKSRAGLRAENQKLREQLPCQSTEPDSES